MAVCAATIDPRDRMVRAGLAQDAGMRLCQSVFGTPLPANDDAAHLLHALATRSLHHRRPNILDTAERFGCHVRTLQRLLQAQGTSYSAVIEQTRQQIAVVCLGETDLPIQEIARLLGYSNAGNFIRAFRRWTGMSPGRFRCSRAGPGTRSLPVAFAGDGASGRL